MSHAAPTLAPDPVLQTHEGTLRSEHYLPSTPDLVLWGRLPCAADAPVLRVESGSEVTIDTISHEGILEDQGRGRDRGGEEMPRPGRTHGRSVVREARPRRGATLLT